MLHLILLIFFPISQSLLITSEHRVSTRNITCQHGSSYSSLLLFNCEACLVLSRNYAIDTLLSMAGSGPSGTTYLCLHANEIEPYHENLVRECQNFPRETLNGYDDFCVASPFNKLRGSYRACICASNACNWNHTECVRQTNPYWDRHPALFKNTVTQLTNRIKCYRPYEDYRPQISSALTPLCQSHDDECKNFVFDHGVACAISVDRTNQIFRQTLPPSIYTAKILQIKSLFCGSFTFKSKSIYFSKCQQGETICVCSIDGCDKDLDTCRSSRAALHQSSLFIYLIFLVINIYHLNNKISERSS